MTAAATVTVPGPVNTSKSLLWQGLLLLLKMLSVMFENVDNKQCGREYLGCSLRLILEHHLRQWGNTKHVAKSQLILHRVDISVCFVTVAGIGGLEHVG